VLSIVITERGGSQRQLQFEPSELTIGRVEQNDVVLPRSNVSKHHAQLIVEDARCVLTDLNSTNGTYVNGRRINDPWVLRPGDKIYIGDYMLTLHTEAAASEPVRRAPERAVTQPLAPPRPQPRPAPNARHAAPGHRSSAATGRIVRNIRHRTIPVTRIAPAAGQSNPATTPSRSGGQPPAPQEHPASDRR